MKLCECGCGAVVKNRFKLGHQQRTKENREKRSKIASRINKGRILSEETKRKIRDSVKGFKHTEEAKQKIRKANIGRVAEKSSAWKGGVSVYGIRWNAIKKEIKKRDNYKCRNENCKNKSKILSVHHKDFIKINNDYSNLITLCKSCHSKLHPKGFIKTQSVLIEYKKNCYIIIKKCGVSEVD